MESWRDLLAGAIESGSLSLSLQPMVNCKDGALANYLAFSSIPAPVGEIKAGLFLPVAERLGLIAGIDRLLLARVLAMLEQTPDQTLAISLGVSSVGDDRFCEDLLEALARAGNRVARLWVDIPELALNQIGRASC